MFQKLFTTKVLSTFLQQITVKIKINYYPGPVFELKSRLPQESVLGQILYSLYANDTTEPEPDNLLIMFTDVTQIITTDKSR